MHVAIYLYLVGRLVLLIISTYGTCRDYQRASYLVLKGINRPPSPAPEGILFDSVDKISD